MSFGMLASTSLSSIVCLAASALRPSSTSARTRPEHEVLSSLTLLLSSPRFDVNRQNGHGDTLLHTAARNSHVRVVELLLLRCPTLRVDVRNSGGFTALDFAGRSGNLPIIHALVAAGADPSSLLQPKSNKSSRLLLHPSLSSVQLAAVVSSGRAEYRRRLLACLSASGVTGTAYLPPELQSLVVQYVQGASEAVAAAAG